MNFDPDDARNVQRSKDSIKLLNDWMKEFKEFGKNKNTIDILQGNSQPQKRMDPTDRVFDMQERVMEIKMAQEMMKNAFPPEQDKSNNSNKNIRDEIIGALAQVMVKDPEKGEKLLKSLDDETLDKLNSLGDPNSALLKALQKNSDQTVKPQQSMGQEMQNWVQTLKMMKDMNADPKPQNNENSQIMTFMLEFMKTQLQNNAQKNPQTDIMMEMMREESKNNREMVQALREQNKHQESKYTELMIMTMNQKIEELKNQPSPADYMQHNINTVMSLYNDVKKLGGGGDSGSNMSLEERKYMLDHEKWKLERQSKLQQEQQWMGIASQVVDKISEVIVQPQTQMIQEQYRNKAREAMATMNQPGLSSSPSSFDEANDEIMPVYDEDIPTFNNDGRI